jgi:DNA-binding CsgD family transcriptional regulator
MAEMQQNAATVLQCNLLATLPPPRVAELRQIVDARWFRSVCTACTRLSGQTVLTTLSTDAASVDCDLASASGDASSDSGTYEPDLPVGEDLRRRFRLTDREAEVALLLAQRHTSKEIACVLGVSWHTARRHTERVLGKLGVNSRRQVLAAITHAPSTGAAALTRAYEAQSHASCTMPYTGCWAF